MIQITYFRENKGVLIIKNRTVQLIYQTIYCTLGLVGCVASLGIFDDINTIRWDFYVHFTNISNFLCIGILSVAFVVVGFAFLGLDRLGKQQSKQIDRRR